MTASLLSFICKRLFYRSRGHRAAKAWANKRLLIEHSNTRVVWKILQIKTWIMLRRKIIGVILLCHLY